MISKWCLYHIVRFKDLESQNPPIEMVPLVREFPKVFPNDNPRIPPEREINFCIEFLLDTYPISIPPYRMTHAELKELKPQIKDIPDKKASLDLVFIHRVLRCCL